MEAGAADDALDTRAGSSDHSTEDGSSRAAVQVVGGAGREQEFADFARTASPALGRTAWLLCGDVHRAEELVQQVLVRTYLAWDTARDREPLAYARRVLANLCIDGWRPTRREVLTGTRDLPDRAVSDGADTRAVRDELACALQRLTPRRRRVVVLRHVHGLSERETAETLGISVAAVKSAGSRGLAQLRGLLTEQARSVEGRTP